MLRHGQNVSVGIFEPCDLLSCGSGPDSKVVLLEESEYLETDPFLLETPYYVFNIRDLPAENGELRRLELGRLRHPDHDSIRIHHEREAIIFYKTKSEHAFVKGSGLVGVPGGNESNNVDW